MNAKNIITVAATAIAVLFALDFLVRKAGGDIVESIADINKDTPFEGFGVVGALGNVTNRASGGFYASLGSAIGLFGSKTINLIKTGEFR